MWILDLILGFGGSYLKELLIGAAGLVAIFFANHKGKKAGRLQVERESQQKHAHDVGVAGEAENAHKTRTDAQRKEAQDKWTVK